MENLPTYRLTQSGPEAQEILDQVNLNTIDIEQLKRLYQALTQSEPEIIEPTDTWPVANPEENVIYRVIDRVHTPPQYYSDYMWNGTSMVPMAQYNNAIDNEPTANSNNLVKSSGVYSFVHANGGAYDISAAHAVGGVLATYDDLADALGTNGANVPAAVRKGGMSIKFVLSSDNNYVRFNYLLSSTSDANIANVANWQGVDDKPTAGSENLVKSKGILNEINESDKGASLDFTKSGSTTINRQLPFDIVGGDYYKVMVNSSNNKISKVNIALDLGGGHYQSTKVENNNYAIFKAQNSNSFLWVQNSETISGTDNVEVVVFHLKENADVLLLGDIKKNIDFSIKSIPLHTDSLTKSGSTTLNHSFQYSFAKDKKYAIEVKTTNKLLSYINWVYEVSNSNYIVTRIPINNGYGILQWHPSIDITSVTAQNTETIVGTDSITISSYDISEASAYELIEKCSLELSENRPFIDDIRSELIASKNLTKSGGTVLNYGYDINLSSSKVYTFNVKSDGKISNLKIAYQHNGGYIVETIPVYGNNGYTIIQFKTDVSRIHFQNTETIEGNDKISINIYDSTKTKVYRIIKDECFGKIADVENAVLNVAKMFHYETGDYTAYNIKHVGVGYEYEEPMLAINSISNASEKNRYLIMLHGDFEVTDFNQLFDLSGNRCSREIVENGTNTAWSFIFTKDYVDIIGANKNVKIKYNVPIVNSNQKHYLHTIYDRGTVNIANLTIDVTNSRYCIHQENGSGSSSGADANSVKFYKNLTMINRSDASYTYTSCFGIGTAPNQTVIFENCNCVSVHGDSINNIHSHSNYAYPFTYHFKNCRFDSLAGFAEVYYRDLYSGVKQTFIIEGCIFPSFGEKRGSYNFSLSLSDNAHDYRNGGAYISGHGNNFVMVRETAPCLVFETTTNNGDISAVSDDIVGDCLVSYDGTADAHGVFVGTELIMSGDGSNVLNLGSRLGDCTIVNKTLVVTIDEVQQTVVFAQDYSNIEDTDIISYINSQLTDCICYVGFDVQIPTFNDESVLAINNGGSTIEIGDLLVLDIANGYNSYKKCQEGDLVDAVATKRINPGDSAYVVAKYHQKFNNIGGMSAFTDGEYYQADNNGKIKLAANESNASFRCIGDNILEWVRK